MKEHQNCHVEPVEKPVDREALSTATVAYLAVLGMGCDRCATRVRNGLLSLEGVLLVDINLEKSYAAAAYDPQRTNTEALVRAVEGAGNDGRHRYSAELYTQLPALEALAW